MIKYLTVLDNHRITGVKELDRVPIRPKRVIRDKMIVLLIIILEYSRIINSWLSWNKKLMKRQKPKTILYSEMITERGIWAHSHLENNRWLINPQQDNISHIIEKMWQQQEIITLKAQQVQPFPAKIKMSDISHLSINHHHYNK